MNYFAYGSNMSTARLRIRVPSAVAKGVVRLSGHKLAWHKVGKDDSGKCDIVRDEEGSCVFGVLFEIDPTDKEKLDVHEGAGSGYETRQVEVVEERSGKVHRAFTYCATKTDPGIKPFTWYKNHVLLGAREHQLPPSYIEAIESVVAIGDPDANRAANECQMMLPPTLAKDFDATP